MHRFVLEVKRKGARREGEMYEALAENVEKTGGDDYNYFESLMSARERELMEVKADIMDYATEHQNVEENYKEMFTKSQIHLADIGFPIKKTGAKVRSRDLEDVLNAAENERDSRLMSFSKGKRSSKKASRAKSLKGRGKSTSPIKKGTSSASAKN